MKRLWPSGALVALALVAFAAGHVAARAWREAIGTRSFLSAPPTVSARASAGAFRNWAADLHFLNFVVYFGRNLRTKERSINLQPVLDLITDLDPRFEAAYVMGAMALGDGGQVDEAEALWAKGLAANPGQWRWPYQAGMNLFLFGNRPEQYLRAASLFAKAAALPGAPASAKYMEGRMYDVSLRKSMAIRLWMDLYLRAPRPEDRAVAARSLARWQVPLPPLPPRP